MLEYDFDVVDSDCSNDLHVFNPEQMLWSLYSSSTFYGSPPSLSTSGFTEALGSLYIFGGQNTGGNCLRILELKTSSHTQVFRFCIFQQGMFQKLSIAYSNLI